MEELKMKDGPVEGTITIGCGEFEAVDTLAKICDSFLKKYPMVQIRVHTGTADTGQNTNVPTQNRAKGKQIL